MVRKSCLQQLTPVKCIGQQNSNVLFDSIQAFSFDKRFTDLNPSESRKNSSSLIVLFSTLKRGNSRISLNEAIQCSLSTSATSRDGSLLKHLFFPLWTTFSTQTSLVFSRRRPQTLPGCLRSLKFFGAFSKIIITPESFIILFFTRKVSKVIFIEGS